MTAKQRQLVQVWMILGGGSALFLVAITYWGLNPWLVWLIFPLYVAARKYDRPARDPDGSGWINYLAENHPWTKWWIAIWSVVFLAVAIWMIRTDYSFPEDLILPALAGAFAIMLGPFVLLHESQTYREYGR